VTAFSVSVQPAAPFFVFPSTSCFFSPLLLLFLPFSHLCFIKAVFSPTSTSFFFPAIDLGRVVDFMRLAPAIECLGFRVGFFFVWVLFFPSSTVRPKEIPFPLSDSRLFFLSFFIPLLC